MNEKETPETLEKEAYDLEIKAKCLRQKAEQMRRGTKKIGITGNDLIQKQQEDEQKRQAEKNKGWV